VSLLAVNLVAVQNKWGMLRVVTQKKPKKQTKKNPNQKNPHPPTHREKKKNKPKKTHPTVSF